MADKPTTTTEQDSGVTPEDEAREAERIRLRRQRVRSLALAWGLAALALLFFLVTLVRLGGDVFNRPL